MRTSDQAQTILVHPVMPYLLKISMTLSRRLHHTGEASQRMTVRAFI
jgi:hypothetical protein